MEGFWGILKTEMYYPHHFEEYSELYEAIAAYINFYNYERYQKKLGCMTPMWTMPLAWNVMKRGLRRWQELSTEEGMGAAPRW